MSDTRLSEAERIFADAMERDPAERAAFIREHCGSDAALRAEVERLMAAGEASEAYFGALPGRLGIDRLRDGSAGGLEASPGQQVGQYRLTRLLGAGGMGTVWCAERADGRFEGEVAVKLLTRTRSPAALERFDREAHYLARLTHPNIARLLDAGVGPGDVPYLILEYVKGEPIDRWCRARSLGIEARLRLLMDVAEAVAHAHSRLIVHSDIKPSNVLVTNDGVVKLLDFGISTLIGDDAAAGGGALTPELAAPEQLAGEPVSTATDVYALGLLLYLLLTGDSPRRIDAATDMETLRRLAMREPDSLVSVVGPTAHGLNTELTRRAAERGLSPGRLVKILGGELDPIARKALAVDREARYRNASEFKADLACYLERLPVSAVPNTVNYRARKFVQRHRGGILSALLTTLALFGALGLAVQQMFVARAERDTAEYERQRVAASNEFYGLLLEEMGSAARPLTALELLDRGAELLERQFDEGQPFMGRVLFDLSRRYANVAETGRAFELLALAEQAARASNDHDLLAATLCAKATPLLESDLATARPVAAEAMTTFQTLSSPTADTGFHCIRLQSNLARSEGNRDRAIAILTAELEREESSSRLTAKNRALLLNDLGLMQFGSGDVEAAMASLDDALATLEAGGRGSTFTYMKLMGNKAVALASIGEYRASVEIDEALSERFDDALWTDDRGQLQGQVKHAGHLVRLSRVEEALPQLIRARALADAAGDASTLANAEFQLAACYIRLERYADAENSLQQAEAIFSASPDVWVRQMDQVAMMRATIARARGDFDTARGILAAYLENHETGRQSYPVTTIAALFEGLARLELAADNFAEAEAYGRRALETYEPRARAANSSAHVGGALVLRAKARYGLGDVNGAIDDLARAVAALGNGLGEDNVETAEARELLAAYRAAGPED